MSSLQHLKALLEAKEGYDTAPTAGSLGIIESKIAEMKAYRAANSCSAHNNAPYSGKLSLQDLETHIDSNLLGCSCNANSNLACSCNSRGYCDCDSRTYSPTCDCNSECDCQSRENYSGDSGACTCHTRESYGCECYSRTTTCICEGRDGLTGCLCLARTPDCSCLSRTCDCQSRTYTSTCSCDLRTRYCSCQSECSCNAERRFE